MDCLQFMSILAVFQSDQDQGRMILNGCMQPPISGKDFLPWESNLPVFPNVQEQKSGFYRVFAPK